jgi:vancomycin resistance protein YoaR
VSTLELGPPLEAVRPKRRSGWRIALAGFLITLGAAALLALGGWLAFDRIMADRVMPGVSIAGVPVGGLERSAAEERLRTSLPDVAAGTLTLRMGEETMEVPYASLARGYQLDAALEAAITVGRTGGVVERTTERVQVAMRGVDVPLGVTYDAAALDATIEKMVAAVEREARDASVRSRRSTWAVEPAVEGLGVDETAARSQAHAVLSGPSTESIALEAEVSAVDPAITTQEAQDAVDRAEALASADLTLVDGEQTHAIPAATIRSWLSLGPTEDGGYAARVDPAAVEVALSEIAEAVKAPATDATFAFGPDKTVVAVPAKDGRSLDAATTTARILAALDARSSSAPEPVVSLATIPRAADFTTAQAQAALPKVQRVSAWTTRFIPSEMNFYGKNISIPASKIGGQTVAPGRWFDFWKAIGEVSRAEGYGLGGAIINGRTEPTGALAGGICSCSTTIFNAALRAGLQMGDRRNHYYYITRYPVGLDATVFKSSSGAVQTMRFKNDTDYPLLIRAVNRYGLVRFEIWTVPTGRTVTFTEPRIRDRRSARDTIEYTDSLPAGATKRVEYPADGFRAWVTRTVRDASGAVIHEETYYSNYSAVDGVTLVGRRPGDPPAGTIVFVSG